MQSTYAEKYFTTRDGLKIYYRDYGDARVRKPPVLCLPGSSTAVRAFEHVAPRLAEGRRVLAMDWRGHGRSDYDPDYRHYGFEVDRDDVLELLAHEKVPQVVIIGSSRGGIIAMGLAGHRPDVLAGVVMNDIGPVISPDGMKRAQANFGLPTEFRSFEEAAVALRERQVPDLTVTDEGWLRHARQYHRQDEDGVVRPDFDPGYARAFREIKATRNNWPLFDAMAHIPALVIRGAHSDLLDQPTVDEMKRRKPDLGVCIVPGRAHCPYLDEPESIDAIDAFLARI